MSRSDPPPEGSPPEPPEVEPPPESSPTTSIWFWLTFLFSPLATILFFASRDDEQRRELKGKEDRIRRDHPDLKEVREAAINEILCPKCLATINTVTGDGYHSPNGEPWVIICNQCEARVDPDI